jgi:membrane protein
MSRKSSEFLRGLPDAFRRADIGNTSAALAFHTLLSIVPFIAFILWYLKKLGINREGRVQVRNFIFQQFDVGSGEEFFKAIEKLTTNVSSKSLNVVIYFVLIYTIFNLTRRCGDGLDRAMGSRPLPLRSFTRTMFVLSLKRGFALLTLPLFILSSIMATSWLKSDSWFRYLFAHESVGPWLGRPIPWLIDGFAIFMLYAFIPKKHMGMRNAFKSALIAGPLFEVGKTLIATYAKNAITVQKIYGALAVIPIFVMWIQFSWMIVLSAPLLLGLNSKSHNNDSSSTD